MPVRMARYNKTSKRKRKAHNMKDIIETHDLTKTYGDFTAVYRLNLHIRRGTVYGFLGPNGAGKSTTMKMFLGLTRPTVGDFTIDGKKYPGDRMEILRRTGSLIEEPAFYGNLSGRENLDIIRRIHERGTTVVMVCHDMEVVADYAARCIVMSGGEVVDDAPTFDVLRNRETLERASLVPPQIVELSLELGREMPHLADGPVGRANTLDEMAAAVMEEVRTSERSVCA